MKVKEKDYSPEAIAAFNLVGVFRTPQQAAMAAPLDEYKKTLKVEDLMTPEERITRQNLINLAKAAVAVPQDTGFDSQVKYDNFYDVPSATVLKDLPLELVPTTYMYSRGDVKMPLEKVTPGLPGSLLADHDPSDLALSPGGPRFRKELALWLTKPDHPLTARVMVNRIWEGHFGAGIVATENDFGHQGVAPSNPQLLDWLATEFVREGCEVKQKQAWSDEFSNTGYVTIIERERLDPNKPGDLKEALNVNKQVAVGIDASIVTFYDSCTELANTILQAYALALELPEDYLTTEHDRQNHTLRLLHYPPLQTPPKPGQVRAGEHSDYGSLTLLFQDDVGGRNTQTASGEWIAAPAIPDTVVVNTGDLMQRWTNHVFCSTKH